MPMEGAMERTAMRMGEVAARVGVHRETLRYYERRGLIPAPPRRPSWYRAYPGETVERVRLIKWAQGLGFTLREIAELGRIPRDHMRGRAAQVRAKAAAKIHEINTKIDHLRAIRRRLQAIATCRCRGARPIVSEAVRDRGGAG